MSYSNRTDVGHNFPFHLKKHPALGVISSAINVSKSVRTERIAAIRIDGFNNIAQILHIGWL